MWSLLMHMHELQTSTSNKTVFERGKETINKSS